MVLKWGGVGLVVLAVAFLVSTAITRGWIGPELQLAGAVALACALGGTGIRLRPISRGWTHALCTAGALVLVITCSSNLFREQAGDTGVLVATGLATAVGVALARFASSQWVGAATVAVGTFAWFAARDGEPPVIATVAWIAVLAVAVIALSLRRGWFGVRLVTHVAALAALAVAAMQCEGAAEQSATVVADGGPGVVDALGSEPRRRVVGGAAVRDPTRRVARAVGARDALCDVRVRHRPRRGRRRAERGDGSGDAWCSCCAGGCVQRTWWRC